MDLKASAGRDDVHNPTHKLNQKVFNKTKLSRKASPPVTPPARTGIISMGRKAKSMQMLLRPDEPSFPNSTSPTLTRDRNSKPSVPSRRSRLIASAVKRKAKQLTPKPAQSIPLKTKVFISVVVPNVPIQPGIQSRPKPSTTPERDQYVSRLRAATRNSRSTMGSAGMVASDDSLVLVFQPATCNL